MNCDDCGRCCEGQAYLPSTGNWLDHVSLPAVLEDELERLMDADPGYEGTCVWYDQSTRRCQHYELRPSTCREFEVGCFECLQIRAGLIGPFTNELPLMATEGH